MAANVFISSLHGQLNIPSFMQDRFKDFVWGDYKALLERSTIAKSEHPRSRSVTSCKLIDDEAEEAYSEEEGEEEEEEEFSDEDPEESSDESLLSDVEDTRYQSTGHCPRTSQKMKLVILDSDDDEVNH